MLLKSSKRKQKLYNKFLKNKSYNNEKLYYSKILIKYQSNIKETWQVIKVVIGTSKSKSKQIPRRLLINDINVFDKNAIAENFNQRFVDVGHTLATKVPNSKKCFQSYMKNINNSMS